LKAQKAVIVDVALGFLKLPESGKASTGGITCHFADLKLQKSIKCIAPKN
jgi:hypothetical protein